MIILRFLKCFNGILIIVIEKKFTKQRKWGVLKSWYHITTLRGLHKSFNNNDNYSNIFLFNILVSCFTLYLVVSWSWICNYNSMMCELLFIVQLSFLTWDAICKYPLHIFTRKWFFVFNFVTILLECIDEVGDVFIIYIKILRKYRKIVRNKNWNWKTW